VKEKENNLIERLENLIKADISHIKLVEVKLVANIVVDMVAEASAN
jgi:hypothetical protein